MKHTRRNKTLIAAIRLIVLAFGTCLSVAAQTPALTSQTQEARELLPAQKLERTMKGAEKHRYKMSLKKDDFLQVSAEQQGIDVVLELFDADGKLSAEMDSPNGTRGPEILLFIATETGVYTIEVGSLEANAAQGIYTILLKKPLKATEKDKKLVTAADFYNKAILLSEDGALDSKRAALVKLREAEQLYREINDKKGAINSLLVAAFIAFNLGDKTAELQFYEQALPLCRAIGNKAAEYESLIGIAGIYQTLGGHQKALKYLNQILLLAHTNQNKSWKLQALSSIGFSYHFLNEIQKAIYYYKQSLLIARTEKNKMKEVESLIFIGDIYTELGEKQKALKYYSQTVVILRDFTDKDQDYLSNVYEKFSARDKNNVERSLKMESGCVFELA